MTVYSLAATLEANGRVLATYRGRLRGARFAKSMDGGSAASRRAEAQAAAIVAALEEQRGAMIGEALRLGDSDALRKVDRLELAAHATSERARETIGTVGALASIRRLRG